MKKYRVIVTPDAENDLKAYLAYLRDVKKNTQAVNGVLADFQDWYVKEYMDWSSSPSLTTSIQFNDAPLCTPPDKSTF